MSHHSLETRWKLKVDMSPTEDGTGASRLEKTHLPQDFLTIGKSQPSIPDNRDQLLESATSHSKALPGAPRKFLAKPIEILSRSSEEPRPAVIEADQFALSPSDTGSKVTKGSKDSKEQRPARKFLPEPIETSKSSNRRAHSTSEIHQEDSKSPRKTLAGPRRFTPNLIETDTRSVRKGKFVQLSHQHNAARSSTTRTIISPETPFHASSCVLPESQFSYSSLLRRQQARRHSFRVPDLPSIPSNSSEESDDSRSHSTCTSPLGSSSKMTRDPCATKLPRESCDGGISDYLLSLAARSAQKQLKEQALAAFPNEQVYQPVDHFAIGEDDGDLEEHPDSQMKYQLVKSRRQSSADLSWELEYMRHHKEESEMRLRAMVASRQRGSIPEQNKNENSPPMLGNDLVLPQSVSPEGSMCEHSSADTASFGIQDLCSGCSGLWCAAPHRGDGKVVGLWMGTCCKEEGQEREFHGLLPGIVTPMPRVDEAGVYMGLSPSPSHTHLDRLVASPGNHISRKPTSPGLQTAIKSEFHDGFVTQIYNYLSLGYPCLARYYDYELSRISGIPVQDLRRDDLQTDAKGYVVAPENDNLVNGCARWKALRLYILEWARQEPGMAEDETNLEGWGLPERKGSWAI
ncbi:hypothetical protein N7457_007700 [Penicillium paradoxum]|uniref:uncharacterized protein n=1 Tax=Penicillium paradoxum TaxID=176176 RepID=UPI0025480C3D|nr:uncharacterized protein N7457_007700 [Penicillium paradoxum]KAJ5772804.1 hypothetical protein N7457_007700 [Penicillium paradoxum]